MSKIQKKLFSNIFLLVLINFLIKPFWTFGVEIKVLNTVGADTFGFYYAVFNFSFLFHIFIDIGINQFHNREIARSPEKFIHQFSQLFNLKIFFSLVYVLVTFVAAYIVRYNEAQFKLLIILGFNQIIQSFVLYNRANFTALFRFKLDTFFSVFDKLLSIVICVYIFYFSAIKDSLSTDFKIEYFIYAQTISLIISFVFSFAILFFTEKMNWLRIDFSTFLPYLKKTLPFAVAVLLMTLYTRIDAVMIERLLPETGDYEAGVYAAGYKILDALNRIPYLFASFLIPVFSRLLKDKEDFMPIFSAALKMLLAISIGATIVTIFWGNDVLEMMYKDYNSEWLPSFMYLIFSFNTAILIYITGSLLTANNNMIAISKMSVVALLINIVLNYILIKQDGAAGASLATLITQASMAVMQIGLVLKLWKFKFSIQYFIKFIVYTLLLTVFAYFLQVNIYYIAFLVVLALGLALAMNLIEWRMFLKPKEQLET